MEKTTTAGKDVRRAALGRGLSALLGNSTTTTESTEVAGTTRKGGIDEIPIEQIEVNAYQPRTHFDEEALRELCESIKAQGIIQPITVRRLAEGQYQLISGERRLRASKMAGLTSIPAFIRTANDEQMLEMALIENIQRQDLNAVEVALAYKRLMDECGLILEQVGDKVGKNRATVNNYLRLLKLPPEIQAALRDNQISMGHARALITVENPVTQIGIFKDIMAKNLSVRQVEEMAREAGTTAPKKGPVKKEMARLSNIQQVQLAELQRMLEKKYATKVRIQRGGDGSGEIRFSFYDNDGLDRLIELMQ